MNQIPAINEGQPDDHNQDVDIQVEGHPFDHPPAWWAVSLETFPTCRKCEVRHVHLPNARTCLECLGNRPGLLRRRRMNEILHNGSFYCSSCYVREAPQPGESCARCRHMRAGAGFRRRLNLLLGEAQERFLTALDAMLVDMAADTFLAAIRESHSALEASREAFDVLQEAHEVWVRMAAIDALTAETDLPALLRANEQYAEISNRLVRTWDVIAARLAAPAGANNAYPDTHPAVQQDIGEMPQDK